MRLLDCKQNYAKRYLYAVLFISIRVSRKGNDAGELQVSLVSEYIIPSSSLNVKKKFEIPIIFSIDAS